MFILKLKTMKNLKLIPFLIILFTLTNCSKDDNEILPKKENISFKKDNSAISFNSVENLKDFMNNYKNNEGEIVSFYKKGFIPLKPIEGLDVEEASKLVLKKQEVLKNSQNKNISSYRSVYNEEEEDEEDEVILNEKFASLLNAKREIIVGDSIYRFTKYGRFSTLVSKKEKLNNYINNINKDYPISEGTVNVTEDIQRFIPARTDFEKYKLAEINHYMDRSSMPDNTSNYNSCHNSRDSWVDRLFGVSYKCEYKFTRKRKLRTTFTVENYGIYMEVYAQAKFKHKTWFGWYSCTEADKIYLKINQATLTFKEHKLTINESDLKTALKYGKQVAKWVKSKSTPVVNAINVPEKATLNYISNKDDNWWQKFVTLPSKVVNEIDLEIDLEDFFNKKTHNVIILSVFDKDYTVTNSQIMKNAYQTLKSNLEKLQKKSSPTGMFLIEHNTKKNNIVTSSYSIFDEYHNTEGGTVVRKYFKIPRKPRIDNIYFGYGSDFSNSNFSFKADLLYPKVDKLNIDLESGALYNGKWGGSKLTINYKE